MWIYPAPEMVPSVEWLYGRLEGQAFIDKLMAELKQVLEKNGIDACIPSMDERFEVKPEMTSTEEGSEMHM